MYKSIILLVILDGCKTWSLSLREEQRLRVFENRVLRRIFGRKKDEVTGRWNKPHKKKLRDLYSSPGIIIMIMSKRLRWVGQFLTTNLTQECRQVDVLKCRCT
jgi:hypothetical protein